MTGRCVLMPLWNERQATAAADCGETEVCGSAASPATTGMVETRSDLYLLGSSSPITRNRICARCQSAAVVSGPSVSTVRHHCLG